MRKAHDVALTALPVEGGITPEPIAPPRLTDRTPHRRLRRTRQPSEHAPRPGVTLERIACVAGGR